MEGSSTRAQVIVHNKIQTFAEELTIWAVDLGEKVVFSLLSTLCLFPAFYGHNHPLFFL